MFRKLQQDRHVSWIAAAEDSTPGEEAVVGMVQQVGMV